MAEHVESVSLLWWQAGRRVFEGHVASDGFTVTRITRYVNAVKPVLVGRWAEEHDCTRIVVTARLPRFVAALLAAWLGGLVGLGILALLVAEPWPAAVSVLLLAGIGVVLYLCVGLAFSYEVEAANRALASVLPNGGPLRGGGAHAEQ